MPDRTVHLLNYPVELGIWSAEHIADWIREFQLIRVGSAESEPLEAPDRLRAMVDHLLDAYADDISEPERLLAEAHERGDATVDLEYPLRPETESVVLAWEALCAEVDDYCESRQLLTLKRAPRLVRFVEWVNQEFLRQARGEEPTPWKSRVADRVRFEAAVVAAVPPDPPADRRTDR